jgi:hypothetical protein
MKLAKMHWVGIVAGLIVMLLDFLFFFGNPDKNLFLFILGISLTVIALPFVMGVVMESKKDQQIGEMFLEFSAHINYTFTYWRSC